MCFAVTFFSSFLFTQLFFIILSFLADKSGKTNSKLNQIKKRINIQFDLKFKLRLNQIMIMTKFNYKVFFTITNLTHFIKKKVIIEDELYDQRLGDYHMKISLEQINELYCSSCVLMKRILMFSKKCIIVLQAYNKALNPKNFFHLNF